MQKVKVELINFMLDDICITRLSPYQLFLVARWLFYEDKYGLFRYFRGP